MKPHARQVRGGVERKICTMKGAVTSHRLGARLIVSGMLTESEIEILWQIFLRRVDSETIFLNRRSIESSNSSLTEFEAD